jgi:predicted O-methyltransferase YrrM
MRVYKRRADPNEAVSTEVIVTEKLWTTVDRHIADILLPPDAALEAALRDSAAAGLPAIAVSPPQGKMLMLLARMVRARSILEIGTLGGYSTIWLARALPADGRLITLEFNPKHVDVARANIGRAGFAKVVEVRVGPALDALALLASAGTPPFDMVFIDADKSNNPKYFGWAVKLSRPGTLIVVDNVIRDGKVLDEASPDPDIRGTRELYQAMAAEPRASATVIQTVGSKGYDGFAMAIVG